MGKITGFMEFDRADRGYRPVEERLKHYKEFVVPLSEKDAKTQASRCMDCGIPYCHNGCPVNNQIPDWNDLVYRGHWKEALVNLHSTNNFPEFTGRVCPAPCEAACTLNLEDKPVTIKTIECAIVDRGFEEGWIKAEEPEVSTGKKVAIIGSGPAGLAAAQQLARAGHEVHVYEKNAHAGGLLRYGIPDFKLEKTVVERRIAQMKAEGVTFHFGCPRRQGQDHLRDRGYARRRAAGGRLREAVRFLRRRARPRPRRPAFRHGLPAAAEPSRLRREDRQGHEGNFRQGQACHRHRRRRHRLRLHRHVAPAGREVGHPARDHAEARRRRSTRRSPGRTGR